MRVALGADHGGLGLKQTVAEAIVRSGHAVVDLGAHTLDPDDDYPKFARLVAAAVQAGKADRGILVCGSGVGAGIAANKVRGIRAATCHDAFSARQGVEDDDMNVLCLGARIIGPSLASELVASFLKAQFSNAARHRRRLHMIEAMELPAPS